MLHALWLLLLIIVKQLKQLTPTYSLLLAVGECSFQELYGTGGEVVAVAFQYVDDGNGFDTTQELGLVAGFPWWVAE